MSDPVRTPSGLIPAAQYVRMSTEHQQYSTENQGEAILRYAKAQGMEIVRTYSDAGKSGLNLAGRGGLRELLQDVERGHANYSVILVYDISRWGRFQDADESAYYEYVCKRANVRVHYCAEQFQNDESLPSSLMKTIKVSPSRPTSRSFPRTAPTPSSRAASIAAKIRRFRSPIAGNRARSASAACIGLWTAL